MVELHASKSAEWQDAESTWFYYYTEPDPHETLNVNVTQRRLLYKSALIGWSERERCGSKMQIPVPMTAGESTTIFSCVGAIE